MSTSASFTSIDASMCHDIAVGAAVLGTGGGGDPHIGKLMAEQLCAIMDRSTSSAWTLFRTMMRYFRSQ